MRKLAWNRNTKVRSKTALGLAVLMACTNVVPSYSAVDEISLINDLGGYGGGTSAEV